MAQLELILDTRSLFEKLCSVEFLRQGFRAVKSNKGAPGIDRISTTEFELRLDEELAHLKKELEGWSYEPKPVRRVEIPKPGGSGVRLLGVPCICDRVVQATLKLLMEPLIDPYFSSNSYGFRPGRSQRQAVEAAQATVCRGKDYVVDIDLSKFFDRVNHDRLIERLKRFIDDTRILRIIGMTLRSGVMIDGVVEATEEGTTQGSPLSPLLSNVVLDELDKELESRGLEFCRFADDCNIFVGSKKAAERVMSSISKYIEKKLRLKINQEKSKIALSKYVKFLGMTIIAGTLAISHQSLQRAMEKVKELTPRGTHQNLAQTMAAINKWYTGWSGYYEMTQYPAQLKKLEAHIRRRLRARIVDQQKSRRNLRRKLVKRGVSRSLASVTAYSHHKRWGLSHTRAMELAYPNRWFIQDMRQRIRSDSKLPHWFGVDQYIKMT
jgi:RNA-directed DNA polymerase